MNAKQPTPPPKGDYMPNRPTSPPPPKRRDGNLSDAMTQALLDYADKLEKLIRSIEAAKQRLESLNGKQVGQAELYAVIEILEGQQ